ncbi:MAG: glycosyltransferase family 2 protein [Candidatus Delongbacteria bacterium]|jgi:glycosyltransferase involved in cell wall biosynthesis|nr:glycosyltransferase family 2 protein [Candidatus Delongbacteria bacterium]
MNKKYLVDIGIICYNHEKMIKQCVDSVMVQETNFTYRVFIIDDCSTDSTPAILRRLKDKYEHRINLLLNKHNRGVIENAKTFDNLFTSKYCCWLDGDDYWSYSKKLQQQINFLEKNKDYAGCFHDAKIASTVDITDSNLVNRSHKIHKTYSQANNYKPDIFPSDIVNRIIIPTASLVYRNKEITTMIKRINQNLSLCWIIHLELIKDSKFKYFNECWSVYRDHPEGFSKKTSLVEFKHQIIKVLKLLLSDEYYKHNKATVYQSLATEYHHLIEAMKHERIDISELNKHIRAFKKYHKKAGIFMANELKITR